jgi:hypothetical protein
VKHVPALGNANYLSVRTAADNGLITLFDDTSVYLYKANDKRFIASGKRRGNLCYLEGTLATQMSNKHLCILSTSNSASEAIWHARLGHVNPNRVKALLQTIPEAIKVKRDAHIFANHAFMGKVLGFHFARIKPINEPSRSSDVFAATCLDQWQFLPLMENGISWFFSINSNTTWKLLVLKQKTKPSFNINALHAQRVTTMHGRNIQIFRVDGGAD